MLVISGGLLVPILIDTYTGLCGKAGANNPIIAPESAVLVLAGFEVGYMGARACG